MSYDLDFDIYDSNIQQIINDAVARVTGKDTSKVSEQELHSLDRWGWWLSYLSKALTRAKRLEIQRAAYHDELYKSILYPSVPLNSLAGRKRGENPATDAQAFRIIGSKDRYEKKIKKEYRLHELWENVVLEWVTDREKLILIRYFKKGKRVDENIIISILDRLNKKLTKLEQQIEQERNELSTVQYRRFKEEKSR